MNKKANMQLIGAAIIMLIVLLLGAMMISGFFETGNNSANDISIDNILAQNEGASDYILGSSTATLIEEEGELK